MIDDKELECIGQWDPVSNKPNLLVHEASNNNTYFQVSRDGSFEGIFYRKGDFLVWNQKKWIRIDNNSIVNTRQPGRFVNRIISSKLQPILLNSYNIRSICGKNLIGSGNLRLKLTDLDNESTSSLPFERVSNKDMKNGYAGLDNNRKINIMVLPDVLIDNLSDWANTVNWGQVRSVCGHTLRKTEQDEENLILTKKDVGLDAVENVSWRSLELNDIQKAYVNEMIKSLSFKTIHGKSIIGSGDLKIYNNINDTADILKPVSQDQFELIATKQDVLVPGNNIRTINGMSLMGGGDINIRGDIEEMCCILRQELFNILNEKQDRLVSGVDLRTINGFNLLGSGDINLIEYIEPILRSNLLKGQRKSIGTRSADRSSLISFIFFEGVFFPISSKNILNNTYRKEDKRFICISNRSLVEVKISSRDVYSTTSERVSLCSQAVVNITVKDGKGKDANTLCLLEARNGDSFVLYRADTSNLHYLIVEENNNYNDKQSILFNIYYF